MTDLKQQILIIKGKLAEKAGLDPYLYNELSSDLSEILQLIEDNYIPKETQPKYCDCSLLYQSSVKFICHGNCKF